MHARIATFEGGDVDRLREMVKGDQRPQPPEGVSRVLVLQGEGRRLVVSFFDDAGAMAAAEARFEAMGDEVPEDVRGRRVSVDAYEVVADIAPG